MAEFDFRCPNCGMTLRIDEAHQRKKTSCPSCSAPIFIPPKPVDEAPQPKLVKTSSAAPGPVPAESTEVAPSGDTLIQ